MKFQIPEKLNKKSYLIGAIVVIIIIAIALTNKKSPLSSQTSTTYTNSKFHYQMKVPSGWAVWDNSKDWDVANTLSVDPKYRPSMTKYPSLEAFQKSEPSLAKSYSDDAANRTKNWSAEQAQYFILANNSSSTPGVFGQNKINIGITHFEPTFMDSVVATTTSYNIIKPFVTSNNYKAFLILTPIKPEDGDVAGVLSLEFNGTDTSSDGKVANGIVFLTSGQNAKDTLLEIANSFKSTK